MRGGVTLIMNHAIVARKTKKDASIVSIFGRDIPVFREVKK